MNKLYVKEMENLNTVKELLAKVRAENVSMDTVKNGFKNFVGNLKMGSQFNRSDSYRADRFEEMERKPEMQL